MIIHTSEFDHITIFPDPDDKTCAMFSFAGYSLRLPIAKSCCEEYRLYFNGTQLTLKKLKPAGTSLHIRPAVSVEFEFGEKVYTCKTSTYKKNFAVIRFGPFNDRIRAVRDKQLIGDSYSHLYDMIVYLHHNDTSEVIGTV